ncbi:MAG: methionyl-tRNA formyltransferase [Kaiparowitsia implicata GSE-PSE-MK54-09C]|jgi:methionyl-tRNA formyltransferase|nr:methionyl-tRNA formyltransferase [Kaiparowitsia implicata GSE-PSE-MK54-09C]
MRLVFFGTPEFAVPSLERLLQQPEMAVVAVVTQPDKRRGRGGDLSPSPIKAVAIAHDSPVWQPRSVKKHAETLENLKAAEADAFVVVAYGQILSPEILAMPRLGCVNAHGSLLPQYRGAAPIQWCLYHGEAETGITTMLMDAGMDTGAMLLKTQLPIGLMDHAGDVARSLAHQAADLLVETLAGLDQGAIAPFPQDEAAATYAPLIQKADYALDWENGAIALHNHVRGFYPNCVTTFRGSSLKILMTVPLTGETLAQLPAEVQAAASDWTPLLNRADPPGTIIGLVKPLGAIATTRDGLLLLHTVKPAGKRTQSGWDFVNGSHLEMGERLG